MFVFPPLFSGNIPPGSGIGYVVSLKIGGLIPDAGNPWPTTLGQSIDYAPPSVSSAQPPSGPTLNPGKITINGKNFGAEKPEVTIQNKTCLVETQNNGYHTSFKCTVADGEGIGHQIKVVVGKQTSQATRLFSYDKPTITSFSPGTGLTSGLNATGGAQIITLVGTNFGTDDNSNVRIFFETTKETPRRRFVVDGHNILSRTHTQIIFNQPRGFGQAVKIQVSILAQESDFASNLFMYEAPSVVRLTPSCGEVPCYGFPYPGFKRVQDYPKIISVEVAPGHKCTAKLKFVEGQTFDIEVGDQIRLSGMENSVGTVSGFGFNFNAEWTVVSTPTDSSDSSFEFSCTEFKQFAGTPFADTYAGWNHPRGNLRALASKDYQRSTGTSFRSLETDGCATEEGADGVRLTKWETYGTFQQRVLNLDANDAQSTVKTERRCDFKQQIVLEGSGFGSKGIQVWNEATQSHVAMDTPLNVTMHEKTCDCFSSSAGVATPCRNIVTGVCAARVNGAANGACPADYEDCALSTKYEDGQQLVIVEHTDTRVVVASRPGYGRRHRIDVLVGTTQIATASESQKFVRYHAPSINGYEIDTGGNSGVTVYRPDGKTRISFSGNNLGYGSTADINGLIEIRIGVEYDVDGTYCGDQDKCMKVCRDPVWHASKQYGDAETRGFPYIDCIIPVDTAGFKNVSIVLAGKVEWWWCCAQFSSGTGVCFLMCMFSVSCVLCSVFCVLFSFTGQKDDCSSNRRLCGYPLNFPTDRRLQSLGPNVGISNLIGDPAAGLIFTWYVVLCVLL